MTENQLVQFIEKDLCKNNEYSNACCYMQDQFSGEGNFLVTFKRNHREQYRRLLRFCADNDGVIIETHPATLATVVRVSTEDAQ